MSLLEVRGLSAGYGAVQVLWDVDLTIEARQIVALVGANGAGKTTLLRAISGMIPSRRGQIRFLDHDITGQSIEAIVDLGVAHVPEGRRLFSGLTVRENLLLGGWRRNNRELGPMLELFPVLGQRLNQVASTLSGGEQQMCAIARGLMGRPELLLIDELSLGLAPVVVKRLVPMLSSVAEAGVGVLLIEQFAHVALGLANTAYVLEGGRVRYHGTAAELRDDPDILRSAYLLRERPR